MQKPAFLASSTFIWLSVRILGIGPIGLIGPMKPPESGWLYIPENCKSVIPQFSILAHLLIRLAHYSFSKDLEGKQKLKSKPIAKGGCDHA
jgi:hypothetical protein